MEKGIKATVQHCIYCFDVLIAALNKQPSPPFPTTLPNTKTPLFVTYQSQGDLRGCIGTFASEDLSKNLGKYALIAAFQDSRFEPIDKKQLPSLSISVSLLVNFTKKNDPMDWQVGKHGIQIKFQDNGKSYSGGQITRVDKIGYIESLDQKGWLQKKPRYNFKEHKFDYILKLKSSTNLQVIYGYEKVISLIFQDYRNSLYFKLKSQPYYFKYYEL